MLRNPVRAVGLHSATVFGPRDASEMLKANTRLQINTLHVERVLCSPGQGSSHQALCPSGKGPCTPLCLMNLKGTCGLGVLPQGLCACEHQLLVSVAHGGGPLESTAQNQTCGRGLLSDLESTTSREG